MTCHRIGRSPISTIGLGLCAVSSDMRVPYPPARITTFIKPPRGRAFSLGFTPYANSPSKEAGKPSLRKQADAAVPFREGDSAVWFAWLAWRAIELHSGAA